MCTILDIKYWLYPPWLLQKHATQGLVEVVRARRTSSLTPGTSAVDVFLGNSGPFFGPVSSLAFSRGEYMGTSQNTRYGSRPWTHTRSIPPDPYLDPYPMILHDPYPWSIPLIHTPDPYPFLVEERLMLALMLLFILILLLVLVLLLPLLLPLFLLLPLLPPLPPRAAAATSHLPPRSCCYCCRFCCCSCWSCSRCWCWFTSSVCFW